MERFAVLRLVMFFYLKKQALGIRCSANFSLLACQNPCFCTRKDNITHGHESQWSIQEKVSQAKRENIPSAIIVVDQSPGRGHKQKKPRKKFRGFIIS